MAISNELLASTLYSIRDGEVDQLFRKTAFLDWAKKLKGIEYEDGGHKVSRPLMLNEHSSITALPTGYEPVSLAVSDVLTPANYDWADFVQPIVISKKEEMENSGEKAIVKILDARLKNVMGSLRRELNKQIVANKSTILTSLNTLYGYTGGTDVGSATGFLEHAAAGAQTNVVGGVSKATYATTSGWQNQYQTAAGAFGTGGLNAMNRIMIAAGARAPQDEVKLILASEAAFSNYKRVLQANERYVDEKVLDGGRLALAFHGAVVECDLDLAANAGGTANDEVSMYFINFAGAKLVMHRDGDFALSPFENITGTTTRGAQLYWKGQLVADHLGSLGVLVGGDTY
jgi:hypothetical protein